MNELNVATIDRVIELAPAKNLMVEGFTHIDKDKSVKLFMPPTPDPIEIDTLTGFVNLAEIGFEGFDATKTLIHVEAFDEVHLVSTASDKYGRRRKYVIARAPKPERTFTFNSYMSQELFNINLRSMFVQTPDLDELVAVAGNIAKVSELKQEDDGFSQSVSAKNGQVMVKTVTLKPRVTLKPFRTFLEVEQPSGDYIFRVQYDEMKGNTCALFEADAGRWKLTAMNTIKDYLTNAVRGSVVQAVNNIPVIA
jgi:hypothetical protein